ncbi:MAG: TOBE domain-containing protein, partial [Actinomycetota bacterium]
QVDTPAQVFHRPADRFVGAFMGEASFLEIDQGAAGPQTRLGPIGSDDGTGPAWPAATDPQRSKVRAMVRPDDLQFAPDAGGEGTIVASEYRGSAWLLTVAFDDGPSVLVAASHLDRAEPGTRGRVSLVAGHRQVPVIDGEDTSTGS